MLNNVNTNVERIIAKIDNDFNPDNSDWIPRVGAWCIDAMSMLKVLRKEDKVMKLAVKDRIAYSNCPLDSDIKVYDSNGCEVKEATNEQCSGCDPSTGVQMGVAQRSGANGSGTVGTIFQEANDAPDYLIAETVNTKDYPARYNVVGYNYSNGNDNKRNYVLADCNKIELNFDDTYITVKYKGIKTAKSSMYGCELPVIPNNGLLIEAIAFYCMYKMLTRGYKHPVFNLAASQYGTNPYYQWLQLKDEAQRSVTLDEQGEVVNDGGLWKSAFFINTFDPRG